MPVIGFIVIRRKFTGLYFRFEREINKLNINQK